MNSSLKTSAFILVGAALLVFVARAQLIDSPPPPDSIIQVTAEAQGLNRVAPADLPEDGTFWMVTPNGLMAPSPCPPLNPTMPIYSLADGQFLVDDTGGDIAAQDQASAADALTALAGQVNDLITKVQTYAARQTMRALGMNVPGPDDGGEGGSDVLNGRGGIVSSPVYQPGTLFVNSLMLSNGCLNFDIHNLITGATYLITRKTGLNYDFRKNWVPEWSFSSAQTNQILAVPFPHDSDTGFYRIFNYDFYQGPSPVITSPADNSMVSGVIQVNCFLSDIFPAVQATLFVDEINFGTVTNGVASWNLDTTLLSNGPHAVDVQFLSEIPVIDDQGSNNIEMWTSDALLYNLNTSNFLAQNVAPRCFTAEFGTVPFAFDTAAPAIVNVSVFDAGSNLVWNTSVTNTSAGTCYPYWNLLDNSGNPVPLPQGDGVVTYTVAVTASPHNNSPFAPMASGSGGASASFSMNISTDPHAGHTAVLRNQYGIIPPGANDNLDAALNQTIGMVDFAYPIHPSDADGWDRGMNRFARPFVFGQNGDLPYFFNILTNQGTGQFMYVCDASGDSFGAGTFTLISDTFLDTQVANVLGNSLQMDNQQYRHRVRLADIEGCNSAKGDLNLAFGSPDGLDHYPAMGKSSFVGWTKFMQLNSSYLPDTIYVLQIKYWQSYWIDGGFDDNIGISHANYQCLQDAGASVDDQLARKIRGSKSMTWIKKD